MFGQIPALSMMVALVAAAMVVPGTPVKAGSRDTAIAAGIVGALTTAIILQQNMRLHRNVVVRKRTVRSKTGPSNQTVNAKDPFAGAPVPTGYAKPVSDTKPVSDRER